MCHNSGLIQNKQIDRFVESGMPQKIVKTVKYTIRKRAEEYNRKNVSNVEDEACEATCSCSSKTATAAPAPAPATTTATATLAMRTTTAATTINSESSMVNLSQSLQQRSATKNLQQQQQQKRQIKPAQLTCPFGHGFGQVKQSIEDIAEAVAGGVGAQFQTPSPAAAAAVSTNRHPYQQQQATYTDILAVFTQWTKKFFWHLSSSFERLQSSKVYTVLTKTTQPAHLIAVCILAFILLTVWPEISENKYAAESSTKTDQGKSHHLAVIAYLGAFATHFGAQIWMTFVSGLSLYFALPRHTFGQCQQILFPKYFALNAMLSIVMVILFVKFFLGGWSYSSCIQLTALALTAVIEVIVRLYLAPPMLRLMHEKYKIEDAVGSGQEVGGLVQGDLVQCPHYQRIHKMFRRIHMTVAIGNIIALLCTSLHLYYLASKISFI